MRNAKIQIVRALVVFVLLAACAPAADPPPPDKGDKLPDKSPAWLAGYRVRYPLRIVGDPAVSKAKSVVAKLPTGGWLKADGSDIAIQSAAGQAIPVAVLSHDPLGDTLIQFPRSGNDRWYWAYAGNAGAAPAAGQRIAEGLTFEARDWAGEDISAWPAVLAGLKKSERVTCNAFVANVIHNCNPARPDDPTKFAASYRGQLEVKKAGVHRFFVNSDDASFLFIDGFKVCEQIGANTRKTGNIPVKSIGVDVDLKAGEHPLEVYHVMGNNSAAVGYCTLLWIPPGEKYWQFVPPTAFMPSLYAEVANLEEANKGQAACFVWGIDDALVSGGGTLFLTRFEAQGAITDPAKLVWDFGDGTTASGRTVEHVYFKGGTYTVSLRSADAAPVFKRTLHVWATPTATSPYSLNRAVKALAASDWKKLDLPRVNQMFEFLMVSEQPERWPILEQVSRHLLAQKDLDPQTLAVLYSTLMESLAEQGKAKEALPLVEPALKEFARLPSLRVGVKLTAAMIHHRYLKDAGEASRIFQAIIDEHRRLDHPSVRLAAIRWGDLFSETGDLAKAAETYRLANALGGEKFNNTAQSEAITRGAQLRIAEQRLRSGDIRQTRQLLERIELDYPEQKLSGLYRFLRAEADRFAGRYEEAIRNYEFILKLTQWAGYHDKAAHGIADCYARMNDLDKALKWLTSLQETHSRYYEQAKLPEYRKLLEARLKRLREAKGGAGVFFDGFQLGFEPGEKLPPVEVGYFQPMPGLGLFGPHASLSVTWPIAHINTAHYQFPIANLQTDSYYWVEFWYRGVCEGSNLPHVIVPQAALGFYYNGTMTRPDEGSATMTMERSYGGWRKIAARLKAPPTEEGKLYVHVNYSQGYYEIDGLSIRPLSDRQNDTLHNFIERVEKP